MSVLQVTIADADEANIAFSTVIGDEGPPRRLFIEENALNVGNLDV